MTITLFVKTNIFAKTIAMANFKYIYAELGGELDAAGY